MEQTCYLEVQDLDLRILALPIHFSYLSNKDDDAFIHVNLMP